MKKLLLLINMLIISVFALHAQNKSFVQIQDSLLQHLYTAPMPTGALWDRVYPVSQLQDYKVGDTVQSARTGQIWHEMQAATLYNANLMEYVNAYAIASKNEVDGKGTNIRDGE